MPHIVPNPPRLPSVRRVKRAFQRRGSPARHITRTLRAWNSIHTNNQQPQRHSLHANICNSPAARLKRCTAVTTRRRWLPTTPYDASRMCNIRACVPKTKERCAFAAQARRIAWVVFVFHLWGLQTPHTSSYGTSVGGDKIIMHPRCETRRICL